MRTKRPPALPPGESPGEREDSLSVRVLGRGIGYHWCGNRPRQAERDDLVAAAGNARTTGCEWPLWQIGNRQRQANPRRLQSLPFDGEIVTVRGNQAFPRVAQSNPG